MARVVGMGILAVSAFVLPLVVAGEVGELKGAFAAKLGDGTWIIHFDGKGKYSLVLAKKEVVAGTYKVAMDEVEFTDLTGDFAAKGEAQTGSYKWKLKDGKLTFTKVSDKSAGRDMALTSVAWTSQQGSAAQDKNPDELVRDELKKMEGTWRLVSAVVGGKKESAQTLPALTLTVKGNNYVYRLNGQVTSQGKLTLDPTKNPKTWLSVSKDTARTSGIYDLDGDTLRVCQTSGVINVPQKFESRPKSDDRLYGFKRQKAK